MTTSGTDAESRTVQVEMLGEKVGKLILHRPQALNALNSQLLEELSAELESLEGRAEREDLRVLIVTGSGEKAFVAGADIKEMRGLSPDQAEAMARRGQKIMGRLSELPIVVIAAVNGFALGGGCELALSCDFIIASERARFGLPEVSLGLIPGYGGTQRLSRSLGPHQARFLALSGEMFSASQMKEMGLVSEVVAPEDLEARSLHWAKVVASRGPGALRRVKQAVARGLDLSLAEGLECEAELFGQTFSTQDHQEGLAAFVEKRAPNFQGR